MTSDERLSDVLNVFKLGFGTWSMEMLSRLPSPQQPAAPNMQMAVGIFPRRQSVGTVPCAARAQDMLP